ncbi:MAG: SAF domain-containing protein [Actinomycetota bacterium]|nr:SAF domain-containing protein [Actinomycetota bacterium]
MKSRARAAAFAIGALACAGLSAAVAGTAETPGADELGPLLPVVVTSTPLEQGTVVGRKEVREAFSERRVPESFAPPDSLKAPAEALGRKLATSIPAGSYMTAAAFKVKAPPGNPGGGPPQGTTPVEIAVTGAGALASTRTGPGDRVDVVVSGDLAPGPSAGRTYVAANGVPLLGLREAQAEPGLSSDRWIATLALTREEALSLIRAESVGAQVRLLAK